MKTKENSSEIVQQGLVDAHFNSAAAYWKAIYEDKDLMSRIYQRRREIILGMINTLGLSSTNKVLEVGCGAGYVAVEIAKLGCTVEATDTVTEMLRLTKQLAVERGVASKISTSISDVHELGFSDAHFDFVLAIGVIPWIHDPVLALKEMIRVLKPGGFIIVTADNKWRLNHVLDPRLNPVIAPLRAFLGKTLRGLRILPPSGEGATATFHSPSEMRKLFRSQNLIFVRDVTVGFGPFSFFGKNIFPDPAGVRIHLFLEKLTERKIPLLQSTGSHYIALVRKSK